MNILILSVGTRNKIIQYFKRALKGNGKIIATDMNIYAPALYEADAYYIVPKMDSNNYLDVVLDICKKEDIQAVISLIDPELSFLAKNEKKFKDFGVKVLGSSYELCERSLDKMQMYYWLSSHNYKCAKSYMDLDSFCKDLEKGMISFPVFVKPIRGSASISVSKVKDIETLLFLWNKEQGLMIQEYIDGQEIGADVYIDTISGEVVSIFTKRKLLMRSGETDKAISFKNEKLINYINEFVKESGWSCQIDIDIFEKEGEFYISEVNPRFGGGYPHAYECGCDHMSLIVNNLNGYANRVSIGNYREDIVMMKYNEVSFREKA